MTAHRSGQHGMCVRSRAFTLVEILAVVVVLGILASIVVANFMGSKVESQTIATESALASVRAAIASYRERAVIAGNDPFPTLAQLTTEGTVLDRPIPENPFSQIGGVQAASSAQADARSVYSETSKGWNYFVDNVSTPPRAVFWCNSSTTTTEPDGAGGFDTANEM